MATQKEILLISHDASRTGASTFLLNLLRWLRANSDLRFSVVLRKGGPLESLFREFAPIVPAERARTPEFLENVELIYSNTCTNGAFVETFPYGTIPIVTHVHEMTRSLNSYGPSNLQSVLGQTHRYVACSHHVSRALQGIGVSEANISVIHSSIPVSSILERANSQESGLLRELQYWEQAFVVACCGSAVWLKGADLFVELARVIKEKNTGGKEIRLVWIGSLPADEWGQKLLRDRQTLGLEKTLEFIGEKENPYPYLNRCDVFCSCSREDSFPLVALEAAVLKKPILCFEETGGAVELCEKGAGFSFPYLDLESMAQAVIRLADDENLRRETGEKAASVVRREFDFSLGGRRIRELMKSFCQPVSFPPAERGQVHQWMTSV